MRYSRCWSMVHIMTYYIVMRCILLFFFKQKTAYEMRISDWSSDVCSSDLAHDRGTDLAAAGRVEAGNLGRARLHPRHPPAQRKIGRASCRERVCQCV